MGGGAVDMISARNLARAIVYSILRDETHVHYNAHFFALQRQCRFHSIAFY